MWKGTIQASEKRAGKTGKALLNWLNQNGNAITRTLVFTPPQADRVQVPISSGVISKDSVTPSGQNKFQIASIELTFQGKVSGTNFNGTADMSARSIILSLATETVSLSLEKQ